MSKPAKIRNQPVDFHKKVFDVTSDIMPHGAWWWWFWLFFIDNPQNPKKPRQIMILWSTKNVKKTKINHLWAHFNHPKPKTHLDVVAAWYFDGEKMNHNYLLEQCDINVGDDGLASNSQKNTEFMAYDTHSDINIGEDIHFSVEHPKGNEFIKSSYDCDNFLSNHGYSLLRLNHGKLTGKLFGEEVTGTAYFQRVFVNTPVVLPWFWGIFHFENGGVLTYFNPHFMGKSIRKDVSFFDGTNFHKFKDITVKRVEGEHPIFKVSALCGDKRIMFTVKSYSHSDWTFQSTPLNLINTKLVYNEYPAVIEDLNFTQADGKSITSKELGMGWGNAEHTTGILL